MSQDFDVVTITEWDEARDAYRQRDLRQALYDEGEVVMADVLVNLHGDEHRQRRRLENRLFRRDVFVDFQENRFPPIVTRTLAPYAASGRAELVDLGHELMMNLAAVVAGVDRPKQTTEESKRLYDYLMTFIEGATLAHFTGDKQAKAAEIGEALERFDGEFLMPSVERRTKLLDSGDAESLPRDVLSVLLENEDSLHLPHEVIRREIAFFLLAGAHTSATAFVRTLHHIFDWLERHEEDRDRVLTDRTFVQRCVHETIRLWPSSPVGQRWALEPVTLKSSGREIAKGSKVVIDLMAINRSTSMFGPDAAEFNPYREIPEGAAPWGQSFGGGMHVCIGQDLAAGILPQAQAEDIHLTGLVPVAVQAIVDLGARPDPTDPPTMDATTARPYWGRYPVVFG
jgi:cytochrome P450